MEQVLRARLQAMLAVGTAVDWNLSLQGVSAPRVVLFRVSGDGDTLQDGPSGFRRARVQADCYAPSYAAAVLLSKQVIAALNGWKDGLDILGAFLLQVRDLPPDTGSGEVLGRVSVDFNILYQEF